MEVSKNGLWLLGQSSVVSLLKGSVQLLYFVLSPHYLLLFKSFFVKTKGAFRKIIMAAVVLACVPLIVHLKMIQSLKNAVLFSREFLLVSFGFVLKRLKGGGLNHGLRENFLALFNILQLPG